jgi:hypothetical protein
MSDEEKKELEELRKAIRPFLEAYELHKNDSPLSKRKFNMSLNVRIEDWEKLADVVSAQVTDERSV